MEELLRKIFICFQHIKWPNSIDEREDKFNKDKLLNLIKSITALSDIQLVQECGLRRKEALPFFGWGAVGDEKTQINGNVKSDLTFRKGEINLIIENKLICKGKEDYIKNSLVQTVEYLNLYNVAAAILLIFDAGRAKDREWDNYPENTLIRCLTSNYPICVVRVRERDSTRIYYG
jgi:hypothetical protein